MNEQQIFNFIKDNLIITLGDVSESSSCGGEVDGHDAVTAHLLLKNPETGDFETISSSTVHFY